MEKAGIPRASFISSEESRGCQLKMATLLDTRGAEGRDRTQGIRPLEPFAHNTRPNAIATTAAAQASKRPVSECVVHRQQLLHKIRGASAGAEFCRISSEKDSRIRMGGGAT